MANFQGHISTSSALGVAVGAAGYWHFQYDWGTAALGAGLTAIGGMLPDLDSDSGVPVRELFGLAGVFAPLLLVHRLQGYQLTPEQLLVVMGAAYLLVRYGFAELFKRITVHRGMYHSVPAMLIAGLAVFLMHKPDHVVGGVELQKRLFLAAGVMIGFLSHLVLDEICAVDLMGGVPTLNQFAGSALKMKSDSWIATGLTYAILCGLGYLAWLSIGSPSFEQTYEQTITPFKK
ncbi:MAG: metal-dependent hydrolase [Planctomycetes bacterium]|nr:metal-dependent hydrolase [Planctomycetota bacterium]